MTTTDDFRRPTDRAVLASRRRQLVDAATARGLAGVVVFGHGSSLGAGTTSHAALRFLADWDAHDASSLLVCVGERAVLLPASPFVVPLARLLRDDLEIVDARPAAWPGEIARLLESGEDTDTRTGTGTDADADTRIRPGFDRRSHIGVVGAQEMPQFLAQALHRATGGVPWASLDDALDQLRLVKDEEQLRLHRDAAALCDVLFERLGAELRAGRPAWQTQRALEALAVREGADYCRTWLTVRPDADYPRYWREECTRAPEPGDQVLFGVMLTVQGHWGHGIRMGAFGTPRPAHVALWNEVSAMLEAGLVGLGPGTAPGASEAAMEATLRRFHGEDELAGAIRFRNGHGLGLSYEEPVSTAAFPQHFDTSARRSAPAVAAAAPTLAPGMLFELHPNLFLPGIGGAAIGEMALVTPDGVECLLKFPRDLARWG